MKYTNTLILAAGLMLVLSCAKEMEQPQTDFAGDVSEIQATFADVDTKTVLGDDKTKVLWSPNDEISVFYNGDGVKFTSINTTAKSTAAFTSGQTIVYGGTEGEDLPMLYAVYPYSESNAQEGESLTLTVPASQTAVEGSFARGSYPSVGRSKDTNIAFYNVCGGIRFTLSQSGINKITLTGNNDEILAGKAKVQFNESGVPVVSSVVSGENTITLSAPDGTFKTGVWYYISALPTALGKGFTMTFENGFTKGVYAVSKSMEIKRSVFGFIENIDDGFVFPEYVVDLGLSVKWSTCNVGTSKPEEYGTYFAWGDVVGQTWDSSSFSGGGFSEYPPYETYTSGNLKPEYDAAHINVRGTWHMPTKAQWEELINNCTSIWTSDYNGTGVSGRVFTSNKEGYTDKSIFIPATGYGINNNLDYLGVIGYYWSSTFSYSIFATCFILSMDSAYTIGNNRNFGFSIRPVCDK